MKLHEITLRDGKTVYGIVSHIDYYEDTFYVLDQKCVGMIGQKGAGTEYRFDECRSVYALNRSSDGQISRDTNEQISAWRSWFKANRPR